MLGGGLPSKGRWMGGGGPRTVPIHFTGLLPFRYPIGGTRCNGLVGRRGCERFRPPSEQRAYLHTGSRPDGAEGTGQASVRLTHQRRLVDHGRFGRGRGKGTARPSTAVFCRGSGRRKATIGSLGGDFRAATALGIEPVSSS